MSEELATLSAKLDLVLTKLDELNRVGKPGLTQVQFAKMVNIHPCTVGRWIKTGRVHLVRGLIPHAEARKFLS